MKQKIKFQLYKKNKIYKILKKKKEILNYLKICIFKGQKPIQKRREYRL